MKTRESRGGFPADDHDGVGDGLNKDGCVGGVGLGHQGADGGSTNRGVIVIREVSEERGVTSFTDESTIGDGTGGVPAGVGVVGVDQSLNRLGSVWRELLCVGAEAIGIAGAAGEGQKEGGEEARSGLGGLAHGLLTYRPLRVAEIVLQSESCLFINHQSS